MNLQPLRRAIPVLAVLVIALVLIFLPQLDSLFFANARYTECQRMAASDPAGALAFAKAWRVSRPESPWAKHCEALALFSTRDYLRAAEAFVALSKETALLNPTLTQQLKEQAAKAYEAAGEPNEAKALLSDKPQEKPSGGVLLPAPVAGGQKGQ